MICKNLTLSLICKDLTIYRNIFLSLDSILWSAKTQNSVFLHSDYISISTFNSVGYFMLVCSEYYQFLFETTESSDIFRQVHCLCPPSYFFYFTCLPVVSLWCGCHILLFFSSLGLKNQGTKITCDSLGMKTVCDKNLLRYLPGRQRHICNIRHYSSSNYLDGIWHRLSNYIATYSHHGCLKIKTMNQCIRNPNHNYLYNKHIIYIYITNKNIKDRISI